MCSLLYIQMRKLFAPLPCSASINKSSAYHFGAVRVRILLAQIRVMADAQVPVQAAVPAAQALVQPPAAPADVDNPQQDPAPLQVLISFLVIYSLDCFGFSPIRLFSPIRPCVSAWPFVSTAFFFLRKLRFSVVLFISPRPLPRFPHILSLFVMFLCASPHKHRI